MLKVAVIGGGLSGLVLAVYLKKYNISCAVYESRSRDYETGGNIALSPNALRALDNVGVYEDLRPLGYAFDEVGFLNGQGTRLATVLNGCYKTYDFPALRINRNFIRDRLIRELDTLGVPLYFDKKCTGIVEENKDYAKVGFADGEVATAEHIVGADGIHSHIRPFVRPDAQPEYQGMAGITGVQDLDELPEGTIDVPLPCFLYGQDGNFCVMPASPDGRIVSYFATVEFEEKTREGWSALDENKEEMTGILKKTYHNESSWPKLVKALCNEKPAEPLTLWPFYQVAAGTHWTSPEKRVILIGDAAHAMPPSGGQGGATSVEDAQTVAYAFAHIYSTDFDTSARRELIGAWEEHRIARITKIQDINNFNSKLRKAEPTRLHQWIKEMKMWTWLNYVTGPLMGAQFIYSYDGTSVRGVLGKIGRPRTGVSKAKKA